MTDPYKEIEGINEMVILALSPWKIKTKDLRTHFKEIFEQFRVGGFPEEMFHV